MNNNNACKILDFTINKPVDYSYIRGNCNIDDHLPFEVSLIIKSQKSNNSSTLQLHFITHCVESFTTINTSLHHPFLLIKKIAIKIYNI